MQFDFRAAVIVVLLEFAREVHAATAGLQQPLPERRVGGSESNGADPLAVSPDHAQSNMVGADRAGIDQKHVGNQEHRLRMSGAERTGAVYIVE